MSLKDLIIGAVVLVLVVGGFFLLQKPAEPLGANPGPESTNPIRCNADSCEYKSVGACTASSTLFAVRNPFNATSTVTYMALRGTINSATTTDIIVGTSSTPYINATIATSSLSQSLFGLFDNSASATFYAIAGSNTLSQAYGGAIPPNSGTYPVSQQRVVVPPGGYIKGFATSTLAGQTAFNGYTGLSSCNYHIEWTQF